MKIRTAPWQIWTLYTVEAQVLSGGRGGDKATIQGRLAAHADHFWPFDGDKLVSFVDGWSAPRRS